MEGEDVDTGPSPDTPVSELSYIIITLVLWFRKVFFYYWNIIAEKVFNNKTYNLVKEKMIISIILT